MSKSRRLFFWVVTLLLAGPALAQQKKDSTWVGSATGIARDSAHNYVLGSASVAIYKKKDSSLVSYQLSNNFGEFHFTAMPTGVGLIIKINYVGYDEASKEFLISPKEKFVDLKVIDLSRSNKLLQEAVVRARPPVIMNGDTLEFNAEAFRLDENAVGEDLLRKLPGVTVWGDGTITVNGRQVSQVLVDGKPFFGGDAKVATQNISKNAIDKIQVYQQSNGINSIYDSITELNIKLKKDKNFGHFGKLSAGYGTDHRYEADANLNLFRPSTQVSIVAATNNVNKIANDAGALLRNSSYKGNGARIDYQSDFGMLGTNRPYMAGLSLQHDFLPDVNFYKSDRLTADYFLNSNRNIATGQIQTLTSIGNDNTLFQKDDNNTDSKSQTQDAHIHYEKKNYRRSFYIQGSFQDKDENIQNTSTDSVRFNNKDLQSTNSTGKLLNRNSRDVQLSTEFTNKKRTNAENRWPGDVTVNYFFQNTNARYDQNIKTTFISLIDPAQNAYYDRHYSNTFNGDTHRFTATLGDIAKLPFGYTGLGSHLVMKVQNSLTLHMQENDNSVQDLDRATGKYLPNQYLTANSRFTTTDEMPALNLGGNFSKGFSGRYYRTFQVDLTLQEQLYQLTNRSDKNFQNISYSYQKFVPVATLSYSDDQLGRYTNSWSLTFKESVRYPSVDQLVPLVDSSNRYSIWEGNPLLKAADEKDLALTMQHSSSAQNAFNYEFSVTAGSIRNNFSDSSLIDSLGRSVHYTINANGYSFVNLNGNLKRAFKFKRSQLQVSLMPSFGYIHSPGYINGSVYRSLSFNTSNALDLYFTYTDLVAIDLKESFMHYHAAQKGINTTDFRNDLYSTLLSVSVRLLERLTVGSSVAYNINTSTGASVVHFAIWNASASCRMLKGKNLELKLSALDLLHQNTGVTNQGSLNTLTHGSVNVLQQYFMATVSYFPRRFGKRKKDLPPTEN